MRLIDADEFLRAMKQADEADPDLSTCWSRGSIRRIIDGLPAMDAVEVVRCKDCKHCKKYRNRLDPMLNHQLCVRMDKFAFGVEEDDFCSYGERRSDHATD